MGHSQSHLAGLVFGSGRTLCFGAIATKYIQQSRQSDDQMATCLPGGSDTQTDS